MSVAELSEVDGADKAGLSGCNQSQMWSGPRHGGPTTSAVSGGEGEGGRGHSWMTSDPEQGTTSQAWQLPWTRQTTCYHLFHSHGLWVCWNVFRWALFYFEMFTNYLLHFFFFLIWAFFVITKFFVRSFEIVFTSQNKKGLKCQEIVITYVHQHRLQINFSILRNLIWYNKPTSTFTDTFIFTCYHLAIILPSYDYFHTAHINFNWLKGWLFFSFLYTSKLKSNAILKMKKV